MDLFGKNGIMTKIFTDSDIQWRSHKNHDKSKHAFMLNRMMAIQFPIQAQYMNVNGMNPLSTIETWRTIAKQLKRSPGWLYTKMNKADKITVKKLKYKPTDAAIEFYIEKNQISKDQFLEANKLFPVEINNYLKMIDQQLAVYDKN